MKTKIYSILFSLAAISVQAQSPNDALRFSFGTNAGGTARFQAIGGAMGSLGGEFSAALVNPAGLGLYRTNEWVFTPGFNFGKYNNNYRGTSLKGSQDGNFNLGATGFLWSAPDRWDNKNKNSTVAFSVGVTQTANFRNKTAYKGFNNVSSQSEVFLDDLVSYGANGGFSNVPQYMNDVRTGVGYLRLGGTLAYNTGLVDSMIDRTVNPNQFHWNSKIKDSVNQQNVLDQRGGIYDAFAAVGASVNEKWYVGGTFGLSFLSYTRDRSLTESDATANQSALVKEFTYTDYSHSSGLGFNGKLGVLFKPQEFIRLGFAVHSPSFYDLKDEYYNTLTTALKAGAVQTDKSTSYNGGAKESIEYKFRTPWKFLISGSYVFREIKDVTRQKAFITADIEYVPYSWMHFSAKDANDVELENYLNGRNKIIKDMYKGAFNFRIGGELKFKVWMLRAGFAHYGNAFRQRVLKTALDRLSAGVGYRNKGFFVDLTYIYNMGKASDVPYRLNANTPYATLKNNLGNVVATVGVKF